MSQFVREQIEVWLNYYGIPTDFEIESEAEEEILKLLESENLEKAYLEGEQLVFEFNEEGIYE